MIKIFSTSSAPRLLVSLFLFSLIPDKISQGRHESVVTDSIEISSVRPNDCHALFSSFQARLTRQRQRELGLTSQYFWRNTIEERVGAITQGETQVLVSTQLPLSSHFGSLVATITGIENRTLPNGVSSPTPVRSNRFLIVANEAMSFVIETYRERRPHWTPEFLEKLKKIAIEWLDSSTYLTIKDGVGYRNGPIRATIRLIRERDGFLPMEKYLGIQIDVGDKLKVEPGNFAVDKLMNSETWPELLIQLLSADARELVPGKENHYLTYADRYSLSLYSQLGFRPVDPARIRTDAGVTIQDGKILADNVWWTPMEATQATLDGLFDIYFARLRQRGVDPEEIELLRERRSDRSQPSSIQSRILIPTAQDSTDGFTGQFEFGLSLGFVRLNLRSTEDPGDVRILGGIESSSLPMQNGVVALSGHGRAIYQNGVLTIERSRPSYSTRIEIETSPDFSFIGSLRMTHQRSNEPTNIIQMKF